MLLHEIESAIGDPVFKDQFFEDFLSFSGKICVLRYVCCQILFFDIFRLKLDKDSCHDKLELVGLLLFRQIDWLRHTVILKGYPILFGKEES